MNQYALLIEQVPVDCNANAVRCVVKKSGDRHGTLGESEYVFELFRRCETQPCNAELFADRCGSEFFAAAEHNKKKCRALPVCEKQIFAVACTGALADRGTCFHGCGSGMFNAGIFNTHSVQCGVNGQLFFVHHFLSFPSFYCFAAHAGTGCFIYGTVRCS